MHVVSLEVGKAVDDAEKFANVVGADWSLEVEELLSSGYVDSLVFHDARVAAASCVDG